MIAPVRARITTLRLHQRSVAAVATLVLALVLSGCQVTLSTHVQVRDDGSGRVVAGVGLDDEALAQVGDLAALVADDDLREAGWEVEAPRREADGLTWLRASRTFATPEQAAVVLASLSGDGGPFRDLAVTRSSSWKRTSTGFRGRVDLSNGLAGLADPDLLARLGTFNPGLDLEGLRNRFGPDVATSVKVEISADLPGKVKSNGRQVGSRTTWSGEVGQETLLTADAELNRFGFLPLAGGGVGVLAVLLVLVLRRRRRRRRAWR